MSLEKKDLSDLTKIKLAIAKRNAVYKISDRLKNLYFNSSELDEDGYIEYIEGFKIKDIGNECVEKEGISIFKAKAIKDVVIDLHDHENQSQSILVQKGKLILLDSNVEIYESETFFVKKKKAHQIKYLSGTEVLIVFLPNLEHIIYD